MARLQIEFRGAETVVPLAQGETTVGRSNRCTINLPDPDLAEVHFRIRARTKGFQLKDDGSGAGTLVNGKPVYATTLTHGDEIRAGGLVCRFLTESSKPAPAPRAIQPEEMILEARSRRVAAARQPVKSYGVYVWGGIGAVVAVVAVYMLLRESPEKKAQIAFREAEQAYEKSLTEDPAAAAKSLAEAVEGLAEVRSRFEGTKTARSAARKLDDAQRALDALQALDREREGLDQAIDPAAMADAFARVARLRNISHPAVKKRAGDVEEELKSAGSARQENAFAEAQARSDALVSDRKYAQALRVWDAFESADFVYRTRAEEAREAIVRKVAVEYRGLLRLAAREGGLDGRIGLLEASRGVFAGTAQAEDLEVRIAALRARRHRATVVVLDDPKPKKNGTSDPKKNDPTPEAAGPYEDPDKVVELIKQRQFAKAASMLNQISRHPDAKIRVEELTAIASVMADLLAAVKAQPATFTSILMPKGVGRGDIVSADDTSIEVKVQGAKTRYGWDAMPAKSFVKLFRLAGFYKDPRLGVALFFDEEALPKEARKHYVAFHRSEKAPTTLNRILTRRRGLKEIPAGGFEFFRGGLVTRAERENILLLENIQKLGKQARSTNDKRRRAAWAELEKLGEPAVEMLTTVLRERRAAVAQELLSSKAFTPSRFAAKFGGELKQRRKDALAYILDPNKYPYPNKTEAAQAEAERLVGRVRELWEKPYGALLATSEKAQAIDAELRDLDKLLAKYDPLGEPVHDATVVAVQNKLDTTRIALPGEEKRIKYYFDCLAYNKSLKTSADDEERANVLAVNEYRHMMGLYAVKIDERLVRAARKHSIEMMQDKYFAHESPTPHLRQPTQRARREGYPGGVAENIARGASNGRQVFWQWYRSSGHHRNMLNPGHTELGCGACKHHWWTQKFGRATGRRLAPPDVPPDPDPPGASGNGKPAPKQ